MGKIVVKGNDVALVQVLPGDHKYAENTKMAGHTYNRLAYDGKVFTSNDKNFVEELNNGGVETITLDSNEDGQLALTGFITYKKLQGIRKNQMQLDAISVDDFKPTKAVSAAELSAMLK